MPRPIDCELCAEAFFSSVENQQRALELAASVGEEQARRVLDEALAAVHDQHAHLMRGRDRN